MNKRRVMILTVLVLLVAGGFAGWYFFLRVVKVDFDQLGGTVLVYEVVPIPDAPYDPVGDLPVMIESLQRRVDPDGRGLASVQAVGKDRVEIRITRAGDNHADEVARMKRLVLRIGHLEFRILANSADDAEAITHAKVDIDADTKQQLKDAEENGTPPPALREFGRKELKAFTIKLAKGQQSIVTYRWVELSPQELRMLNLDNDAENDPQRKETWLAAKKSRGQAAKLQLPAGFGGRVLMQGALFYSRECKNKNLTEDERKKKAIEYFVLARDPEFDPQAPERRTPAIDGSYMTSAYVVRQEVHGVMEAGWVAPWNVSFTFNAQGAELFRTLTKKNVPTGEHGAEDQMIRRHLAIILDGLVLSAPTINSEIGGQGQITGNFTEREAHDLLDILRNGRLPTTLKRVPVSENQVPPKAK